jgi:long-chain acyl-CoA synthetase
MAHKRVLVNRVADTGMDILLLQLGTPFGRPSGRQARDPSAVRAVQSAAATDLGTAFLNVARDRADHPAVETKAGAFSYDWMLQAAVCVQRFLCARPGYAAGARVALQLANSPEYLAAFYGALLADCVVVPLPASLEEPRRQDIYQSCRPDVLISRPQDYGAQHRGDSSITLLHLPKNGGEAIALTAPRRQGHDLAMLLFTSGSTSAPKGVMLSHRNLLANAGSILRELPICAEDRALVILPFCHAFGNSILQTHILSGATLLLYGGLTFPVSVVEALRESRATTFSAVPEVYRMLLKYGRLGDPPLQALRYMTVAGGELPYDLAAEIANRIAPAPFYMMYGQSEATARLALLPPEQLHVRRGSIGKPVSGVELAVMDEANRELSPGAVGMLCARGENVMLGYWESPGATADVLRGDGWLQTGDLGHRDEDGYFYLHGRANLLVKVQGHRVHPGEIEGIVEAGFPEVHAVAIPVAREEGARFILFLAPRDERPIDVAEIRATCQRELPSYKLPLHFEVLDKLPLTTGLKVDRAALSKLAPRIPMPAA